jgi:hypothetical protein
MSKLDDMIGKEFVHEKYGLILVKNKIPKSRTKLSVEIIERGPGYNPILNKYTGVKSKSGWYRGQNYAYGDVKEVHRKELSPKPQNIETTD